MQAGLGAVVTRHSWYLVGQELLAGGVLVAKLVTKCYDSSIVGY